MAEVIKSGRQGTASYIEAMLLEMRTMSDKEGFAVLTYLLEMALIEATDLAHGIVLNKSSLEHSTGEAIGKRRSA